jgi:hypothetical protein
MQVISAAKIRESFFMLLLREAMDVGSGNRALGAWVAA